MMYDEILVVRMTPLGPEVDNVDMKMKCKCFHSLDSFSTISILPSAIINSDKTTKK